ncbi:PEP-CTERM sorting domain-containing protein [Roseibacillus persicicus]|uniref:PEP-CTERM sorting domain-containing protein n=1 Tax=Roseibacillus persicicus TaxID=454148 RepID=UPI00398AD172
MKNNLIIALSTVAAVGVAEGVSIVSDNFDGLAAGAAMDASADWNAKWATGTTQQNLYKGDGSGGVNLDMSVAEVNYHALNQTGFVVGGTGFSSVTISFDFNYTHNGGGNPATGVNKAFFGALISDQPQWWSGSSNTFTIANRGGAIGNNVSGAPFIEGWATHSSMGVDPNAGGTSSNINLSWVLTDNGTTIDAQAIYVRAGGSFTSTSWDTGVPSGTTLYGGFSTGWNDVGGTLENATNISSINLDNFAITGAPIPEPSAVFLVGLAGLGIFRRRR